MQYYIIFYAYGSLQTPYTMLLLTVTHNQGMRLVCLGPNYYLVTEEVINKYY